MNCKDIIKRYLRDNLYDGLYNADIGSDGCVCWLDYLFPCGGCDWANGPAECEPINRSKVPRDYACGEGCEGEHIGKRND
jgi:hypothetical protein